MMVAETTRRLPTPGADLFGQKMLGALNDACVALMTSVGHRTRLFEVMSDTGPAGSHKIAARARLNERYVREWLGAMTAGGIVDYDPGTDSYGLCEDGS